MQRCLRHLQLLLSLLTHPAGPKTSFFSPLTSEGTRVQTCSSEAGEGARDKSVEVGLAFRGKQAQWVMCGGKDLADKED